MRGLGGRDWAVMFICLVLVPLLVGALVYGAVRLTLAATAADEVASEWSVAVIKFPNGEVMVVNVARWETCGAGIIVECIDGKTFLTGLDNVVLTGDAKGVAE